MRKIFITLLLIVLSSALYGQEATHEFTLKSGRVISGVLGESEIGMLKIGLVMKGRVSMWMDIKESDVQSQKKLEVKVLSTDVDLAESQPAMVSPFQKIINLEYKLDELADKETDCRIQLKDSIMEFNLSLIKANIKALRSMELAQVDAAEIMAKSIDPTSASISQKVFGKVESKDDDRQIYNDISSLNRCLYFLKVSKRKPTRSDSTGLYNTLLYINKNIEELAHFRPNDVVELYDRRQGIAALQKYFSLIRDAKKEKEREAKEQKDRSYRRERIARDRHLRRVANKKRAKVYRKPLTVTFGKPVKIN